MNLDAARTLRTQIKRCPEVSWAQIVMWDDNTGVYIHNSEDQFDPDSDQIHVEFHAYDSLIPASVVNTIAEFDPDLGIYDNPDSFVTAGGG